MAIKEVKKSITDYSGVSKTVQHAKQFFNNRILIANCKIHFFGLIV